VGAAINVKRNDNFAFEFFSDLLEGRLAMAHRLLLNLIMLGCSAILAYQGTIFTVLSMKRYSPAVGISLLVPSLAVPLSAALMCIVLGLQIVLNMHELIRGNR
jgi:TRAP-type C4-dicarboxylate transport system permease small subunit